MSGVFTICHGPIINKHPDPFYTETMDEALLIIEEHFFRDIDIEMDTVCIYAVPDGSGRAELLWKFTGVYAEYDEDELLVGVDMLEMPEVTFPQGRLLHHEETMFEELLHDYWNDDEAPILINFEGIAKQKGFIQAAGDEA